jgi:Zn-dependent protease
MASRAKGARRPTFRIGDIPVTVELSFFLVIGLFALMAPGLDALILWVVIATVSVLVHELGHAVAFRAYGSPAEIRLHGMGGLTAGNHLPPARNLVVSLAGPLSGIVLLGVPALALSAAGLGDSGPTWELALRYAVLINIVWSLVNLLPVLPLDGGNVVQSVLQLATGRDAERTTRLVSIGFATAAGLIALVYGYAVAVLLAAFAVTINVTAMGQAKARYRSAAVAVAQRSLAGGDAWGAVQAAEPVVAGTGPAAERAAASDVQAWAWLLAGDLANTQLALARRPTEVPVPPTLQGALALALGQTDRGLALLAYGLVHAPPGPDHLFATHAVARAGQLGPLTDELLMMDGLAGVTAAEAMATILHHGGRFAEAAALASRLYHDGRADRPVWAYNTACSLARGGWIDDCLGWLQVAVDAGWRDVERLSSDPDLTVVRSATGFVELQRRLAPT